jgi:uncharacterized membrane protein
VRVVIQLLGMVFYPLLVHLLISLELSWLAVVGLVVTSILYVLLVISLQRRTGARPAWVVLYSGLALLGVWSLHAGNVYALFVPSVLINLALGASFAWTLRTGAQPLVEWFVRLEFSGNPPPARLAAYARRCTLTWAVYFAGFAVLSLLLAVFASLHTWSLVVNVLHYVFAISLLFLQYLYRSLVLPEFGFRMPWHTLRDMARHPWPGLSAASGPVSR